MTVLYVLRYYPTLTETFVYREIAELQRRGVRVVVLALGAREDGQYNDRLPHVPVIYPPRGLDSVALVGSALWPGSTLQPVPGAVVRYKDRLRLRWVLRQLRGCNLCRVHAHFAGEAAEWAWCMAQALGVPFSVTVHAVDVYKPRPSLAPLLLAARPVVTISEYQRTLLHARYGVRAVVVPCGVDPNRYPQAWPGEQAPMRVISVGRFVPKKGQDLLVRAFALAKVPGTLRLVGDAPAHLANDRVIVGRLPPSGVPNALAASHVFALPCRVAPDGDRDGFPVAIAEAMAAGLPILTTHLAGFSERLDASNGWIVPPNRVDALVHALREAAHNPTLRAQRGAAARARSVREGVTTAAQVDTLCAAWGTSSWDGLAS